MLFRSKRSTPQPNLALSLRHGGLYLAIAIAMTSALQGNANGFVHDVIEVLRDGAVVVFALIAAQWLNEWCIVPGLDNDQAVADGNTAVALTEFGSYIATGMIASASFGGGEGSWLSADRVLRRRTDRADWRILGAGTAPARFFRRRGRSRP